MSADLWAGIAIGWAAGVALGIWRVEHWRRGAAARNRIGEWLIAETRRLYPEVVEAWKSMLEEELIRRQLERAAEGSRR